VTRRFQTALSAVFTEPVHIEDARICVDVVSEHDAVAMIRTVARDEGQVIKVQLESVAIEAALTADDARLTAWLTGCREALPALMRQGSAPPSQILPAALLAEPDLVTASDFAKVISDPALRDLRLARHWHAELRASTRLTALDGDDLLWVYRLATALDPRAVVYLRGVRSEAAARVVLEVLDQWADDAALAQAESKALGFELTLRESGPWVELARALYGWLRQNLQHSDDRLAALVWRGLFGAPSQPLRASA
jgi:hypothetical protein